MDDRDSTIENDTQVSREGAADRAIDLVESRGDFEIDHASSAIYRELIWGIRKGHLLCGRWS